MAKNKQTKKEKLYLDLLIYYLHSERSSSFSLLQNSAIRVSLAFRAVISPLLLNSFEPVCLFPQPPLTPGKGGMLLDCPAQTQTALQPENNPHWPCYIKHGARSRSLSVRVSEREREQERKTEREREREYQKSVWIGNVSSSATTHSLSSWHRRT